VAAEEAVERKEARRVRPAELDVPVAGSCRGPAGVEGVVEGHQEHGNSACCRHRAEDGSSARCRVPP
jgi:hypothetical protein